MYQLGIEFVLCLPRFPDAARRLGVELDWLPRLSNLPAAVPEIVHAGTPDKLYPFRWAVLQWLDGIDAWEAREHDGWFGRRPRTRLAAVVQQLRLLSEGEAPRPATPGSTWKKLSGTEQAALASIAKVLGIGRVPFSTWERKPCETPSIWARPC
jgi:aminoglycoside phosphotransferase (APT) family kinase protein